MENQIPDGTRARFLLLLSIAAGCVDALAFVNAGVFPANMTGNSVVLALAILHVPAGGAALLPALALAGFCGGAASGAWIVQSPDHAWSRRVSLALLIAGALVLACAATLLFSELRYLPLLILVAATAMGLQSAAVQQLGVAGVATVFVTGTLTTAITRLVGIALPRAGTPSPGSPWLPLMSWDCYFLGALVGGLQERAFHTGLPIALPGLLLIGVVVGAEIRRSRPQKW